MDSDIPVDLLSPQSESMNRKNALAVRDSVHLATRSIVPSTATYTEPFVTYDVPSNVLLQLDTCTNLTTEYQHIISYEQFGH